MKFYVSARPLRYENLTISPTEHLARNFPGISMSSKCIAYNPVIDGRMLYEIVLSDSYSDQQKNDYKDIILEGISAFSGHLKTLQSALALAILINGNEWIISEDSLVQIFN